MAIAAEIILIDLGQKSRCPPGDSGAAGGLRQNGGFRRHRGRRVESVPPLTPALLGVALGLGFQRDHSGGLNWAQRSVADAFLIYTGLNGMGRYSGRLAGERLPLLALLGCV